MSTVFLVDLDKTLIDRHYRPTMNVDLFTSLIDKLVAQGDIFILCSDSALDTLIYWREFFHFNGPIIYENGLAIDWRDGSRQPSLSPLFNGILLRRELVQKISRLFPDAKVVEENYLSLMGRVKRFSTPQLIVFNPYRQYSLSIHALKLKDGKYVYDSELAQDLADYLQDFIYDARLEDIINLETNPDYAINILKPYYAKKTLALPFIRQKYSVHRLVVIGDGLQESFMVGLVDGVWAVNNACPQLKQSANKIAATEITQGVYDLLMDYWQQIKTK